MNKTEKSAVVFSISHLKEGANSGISATVEEGEPGWIKVDYKTAGGRRCIDIAMAGLQVRSGQANSNDLKFLFEKVRPYMEPRVAWVNWFTSSPARGFAFTLVKRDGALMMLQAPVPIDGELQSAVAKDGDVVVVSAGCETAGFDLALIVDLIVSSLERSARRQVE